MKQITITLPDVSQADAEAVAFKLQDIVSRPGSGVFPIPGASVEVRALSAYRVIADTSGHQLPIGAVVIPTDTPEWASDGDWYTQGGDGDEVAIESDDLVAVSA